LKASTLKGCDMKNEQSNKGRGKKFPPAIADLFPEGGDTPPPVKLKQVKKMTQAQKSFEIYLDTLRKHAVNSNIHFSHQLAMITISSPDQLIADARMTPDERIPHLIERLRPQYFEELVSCLLEAVKFNINMRDVNAGLAAKAIKEKEQALREKEEAGKLAELNKNIADKAQGTINSQRNVLPAARKNSAEKRAKAASNKKETLIKAVEAIYLNEDGTPNFPAKGWTLQIKQVWDHLTNKCGYNGYAESSAIQIISKTVARCQKVRNEFDSTQKPNDQV